MKIICEVCPHHCLLEEGSVGFCQARRNENGHVISLNYGKLTGLALDPIEKKPLARYYPGSNILSVGSFGCNMRCPFCQNCEISMLGEAQTQWLPMAPEKLAEKAVSLKNRRNLGLAYTYNEPCIGYEYVRDTARLIQKAGMKNVLVTNGYAEPWVQAELLPYIDAMNIDLKGFTREYYQKLGGDLETVKSFIQTAVKYCHVELTTLILPGENDGAELDEMFTWIAALDPAVPLHITRFFPRWKMIDKEPTPIEKVYQIAEHAKRKLKYVYTGNC
ncbi:AmmeMemoRadiSam system radical SAM enzyme [Diplocloster hominis]|uniref:AmmeMemoRadiSam system radical SAM enzyme n=1 Tax=Diplocloster hominis TaxID=3079010 RepID=UPI0031B9F5C5